MSTSETVVRPRVGFFKRRLTWLGMFVLLLGGGLLIARGSSGGTAAALDKSLLATVKKIDLEVVVLETGRVEPLLQTQIKSKVGGQVTQVEVEEGARVKKGHILLRVDPTDYRRDVARVEAEIAQLRESVNFSLIKLDRSEKARAVEIAPAAGAGSGAPRSGAVAGPAEGRRGGAGDGARSPALHRDRCAVRRHRHPAQRSAG